MTRNKKLVKMMALAVAASTVATSVPAYAAFDATYYAQQNPDVVAAIGTKPADLETHYNVFGKKEGRAGSADEVGGSALRQLFDAEYYAKMNPDVAAVYGNDANALFSHFLQFGIKEGRKINPYFDVNAYKKAYPDLVAAFGDDIAAYYNHFATNGIKEHRTLGGFPAEKIVPGGVAVASSGGSSSSSGGGGGSSKPAPKPADVTPAPAPTPTPAPQPDPTPTPTPVPEKSSEEKAKDALDNAVKAAEDADKALREANEAYGKATAEIAKQNVGAKNTNTLAAINAVTSSTGSAIVVDGENKLTARAIAAADAAITKAQNDPTAANKTAAVSAAGQAVRQATRKLAAANTNADNADSAVKKADEAVQAAQAATKAANEALAQAKNAKVAADDKLAAVKNQINANRTRLALAEQAVATATQNQAKVQAEQQKAVNNAWDALVVAAQAYGDASEINNASIMPIAGPDVGTTAKLTTELGNLESAIDAAINALDDTASGSNSYDIDDLADAIALTDNNASSKAAALEDAKIALSKLVTGAAYNSDGTVTTESVNRAKTTAKNNVEAEISAQIEKLQAALPIIKAGTGGGYTSQAVQLATANKNDAIAKLVELGCYSAVPDDPSTDGVDETMTATAAAEAALINASNEYQAITTAAITAATNKADTAITAVQGNYNSAIADKKAADDLVAGLAKLNQNYKDADSANKAAKKEYEDKKAAYATAVNTQKSETDAAQDAVDAAQDEKDIINDEVTALENTHYTRNSDGSLTITNPGVATEGQATATSNTKLGWATVEVNEAKANITAATNQIDLTADDTKDAAENKEAADEAKAKADEAKATAEQNLETANGQQTTANGIVVTN